jgi:hypothetical protein
MHMNNKRKMKKKIKLKKKKRTSMPSKYLDTRVGRNMTVID